jgi:hypothetical protein
MRLLVLRADGLSPAVFASRWKGLRPGGDTAAKSEVRGGRFSSPLCPEGVCGAARDALEGTQLRSPRLAAAGFLARYVPEGCAGRRGMLWRGHSCEVRGSRRQGF